MTDDESIDHVTPTGVFVARKSRSEIHRKGLWHDVFHCLIIRKLTPASVVLQRRSASAKSFPNQLDLSATGHLRSGESPRHGVRELREELGVNVVGSALTSLGTRLLADDKGEGLNRERVHVFFLADDRPLTEFSPDPSEVQSLLEIPVAKLLLVLNKPGYQASAEEWRPGHDPTNVTIGKEQLVTAVDGYWNVLLVMADRFCRGEEPLSI